MKMSVSESLLSKLYNRETKELFLNEALKDDGTRKSYCVYLNLIGIYESIIKKDLNTFLKEDILNIFDIQKTSFPTSLKLLFDVCKKYITWCREKGLTNTMINPFESFNFKKDILPFLNLKDLRDKYLTEDQLWEIAKKTRNFQDSCPMILAFYGIMGESYIELINLKREDIDTLNNEVKLVNEINDETGEIISTRTVKVSKKVIDVILKAWSETEYTKKGENNKVPIVKLVRKSDFIIKPMAQKREGIELEKPTYQLIYGRVKNLLEENGYNSYINHIYTSGKLEQLRKIEQKNGKVTIEDYKLVNSLFNDSTSNYANIKIIYEQLKVPENRSNSELIDDDRKKFIESFILSMDIDSMENLNPKIHMYKNVPSSSSKKSNKENSETNTNYQDNKLSEKGKYHLGLCGEKLIYKLLCDKNKKLINGLGLEGYNINSDSIKWYNELYNINDETWKDKSIDEGHDIKIDVNKECVYLEVKTSFGNTNYYTLTGNEVRKSIQYKNDYYVIKIKNMKACIENSSKIEIEIIRNPWEICLNNSNKIKELSMYIK